MSGQRDTYRIEERVSDRAPITFELPELPCVLVHMGGSLEPVVYTDHSTAAPGYTPIERAVTVARLRGLADMIEGLGDE